MDLLAFNDLNFYSCLAYLSFLQGISSNIPSSSWLSVASFLWSLCQSHPALLLAIVLKCGICPPVHHFSTMLPPVIVLIYDKNKFWEKAFSCIGLVSIQKNYVKHHSCSLQCYRISLRSEKSLYFKLQVEFEITDGIPL